MKIKKRTVYFLLIFILVIFLSNCLINIKFYQINEQDNIDSLSINSIDDTINYDWLQIWNENYYSHCYATAKDINDNIYLGGFTHVSNGNRNSCFVKYNSSGVQEFNVTWAASGGDDECYAIAVDSLLNIYIAGYMYERIISDGGSNYIIYQMYLAKFNSSGNYQWHATWNGVSEWSDHAYAIELDSLNNIYVVGVCGVAKWETKISLIKFNSTGGEEWSRVWGGRYGRGVTIDSSDNIYVVGYSPVDMCLIKYDYNGQELWNRTWGGSGSEYGAAVILDSLNDVYIAGSTESYGNGGYDMALIKYNSSGIFLWNRTYGSSGDDYARTVSCDSSDNIYIGGEVGCNMGIAKYNKFGDKVLDATWGSEQIGEEACTYKERCYGIEIDSSNNIYIGGFVDYDNIFLMRCDSEFGISKNEDIIFSEDLEFSKWFYTDMELDPITNVYTDRSHRAFALFRIIGYEHYFILILIDKSFADSVNLIIMDKSNQNETMMILSLYDEQKITYNSNWLYWFNFSYYYSYEACISGGDIYCDESITKIAQGSYSSKLYSISTNGVKEYHEGDFSIPGFNLYILISLIGIVYPVIFYRIKKFTKET